MLAPPEVSSEDTLSRWRLSTDSRLGSFLILAARICTMGALMTSWFFRETAPSRTVEVVFYVLWILTTITILANLQSGLSTNKKFELFSGHFALIGQTLISAVILTTSCQDTEPCKPTAAPSASSMLQCISCMNTDMRQSDWNSVTRGIQLKYTKHGVTLILCLLGFESRESRIIYSLIPLQVYMVSFPNLSQAEKITGYMCLSCYVLLCLIKMLDVARKQYLASRKSVKLFKNVPLAKPESEKTNSLGSRNHIPIEQAKVRKQTNINTQQFQSEIERGAIRHRSILIKKTQFQQTEKRNRSKTLRVAEESEIVTKVSQKIEKLGQQEEWIHSELTTPKNESIIQEYSPVLFAAMNSISLLIDKRSRVILSTYNEQTHGELARKLESTIFSGNHDLGDQNLKLDQLLLDKPVEAQFDHITGINLRLMGEAIFQLTEKEKHLYGITASTIGMMQHLISSIMELPRNSMVEVTKKLKHHTPLQILKFVNRNSKELKEVLSSADDFIGVINLSEMILMLQGICNLLQQMASHSGTHSLSKTVWEDHLINKIELKFMWNDGTTMLAKVMNFELEYFVIVQLSGSTESTIQRINAAKAEYVTMMINSLSHEILTPIAEILKNCQSYKLKSRTLGGNTNNTPFQNLNPSMNMTTSGRGVNFPVAQKSQWWEMSRLSPTNSRRFDKKEAPHQKSLASQNSPRSARNLQIEDGFRGKAAKAATDSAVHHSQIMVGSFQAKAENGMVVNTHHLRDLSTEAARPGECPLLMSKRKTHRLEKAHTFLETCNQETDLRYLTNKQTTTNVFEGESIQSIQRVANRIQIFVDGLMAYSQILSNRFEVNDMKRFNVHKLLQELADIFEDKCFGRDIMITIDCPEHVEIISDRKRLACVFLNFLDNSVKFTNQKGSIRVAVEMVGTNLLPNPDFLLKSDIKGSELDTQFGRSGADHGVLPGALFRFKIIDTGIGINKRDMEIIKYTLSNPFHGSPTSSSAGLGIGLRISQAIISQLSFGNADMEIISTIGEGTTISFELPSDGVPAKKIIPAPIVVSLREDLPVESIFKRNEPSKLPVSEPKEKILISPQLELEIHDSSMTISDANGKRLDPQDDTSRIEFPDQFDDTKYTKQQMADLLGSRKFLNSLQPMQDNPRDNSDPVHANYNRIASLQGPKLTKSSRFMVQKTDNLVKKAPARRNILSLKCENTRFMSKKSVNLQQGLTARDISKNQYASQVAVSLTNLFGQPDTKKVLVVDDEVFLLEFLREILETLGLEVYTASSPERAFELSTTLCNLNKKIDLVYMDFNMPGMNGAECIKILKSPPHKRSMEHAWFTALSAQDDKMVRDQFRGVGVSEFISKPYSFEQIVQHLAQRQLISFDNA